MEQVAGDQQRQQNGDDNNDNDYSVRDTQIMRVGDYRAPSKL